MFGIPDDPHYPARFLTIRELARRRHLRWALGAMISLGVAVCVGFLLPT